MQCQEIMKRNVEYMSPKDSVLSAAKCMREANVGFLPVCDADEKVIGTVTDRDLAVRVLSEGRAATCTVEEILTPEVIACRPGDDLQRAQELMAQYQKSRIMCVDEAGRLAGVISLSDIAQCGSEARAAKTLRDITEREATE